MLPWRRSACLYYRSGVDGCRTAALRPVQGAGARGQRRREDGPRARAVRQGVPGRVHAGDGRFRLGEEFQSRGSPSGGPRGTAVVRLWGTRRLPLAREGTVQSAHE